MVTIAARSPAEEGRLFAVASPVHGDAAQRKPAKRRKRKPTFVWRQRDAQDSRCYNLQLDIHDARQQIQALTQWRDMLRARTLHRLAREPGVFVRTVHEYFRVVRHGLDLAPREVDVASFLASIFASSVWVNEIRGDVDMVISQWGLYVACFNAIDLRCTNAIALPIHDLDGRQGFIVRVHGDYTGTLTAHAIAIMFPHVQRSSYLMSKLVGQQIHGLSQYDFVFDCQSGQIVRCDMNVDLFGAFATLLSDPRELSFVFHGAKVESEFYLSDDRSELRVDKASREDPPDGARSSHASKMDLEHILA